MSRTPDLGRWVRLIGLPDRLDELPARSRRIFRFCLHQTFRVVGVAPQGWLGLDVSAEVDARFGGFMNDIWVEPELVVDDEPRLNGVRGRPGLGEALHITHGAGALLRYGLPALTVMDSLAYGPASADPKEHGKLRRGFWRAFERNLPRPAGQPPRLSRGQTAERRSRDRRRPVVRRTSMSTAAFLQARDLLHRHRTDYDAARANFAWPQLDRFNWALDWFDVLAKNNPRPALELLDDDGKLTTRSFAELSDLSTRVASHLASLGIGRGDRILLMLNNVAALWEILLAAMKLGAVVIPATTQLTRADLDDRIARGHAKLIVIAAADEAKLEGLALPRLVVGAASYEHALNATARLPAGAETTRATDPLLLYFTSGTTSKPKLVLHSHQSYPVGHLSTMYWVGLKEGDRHLNISSPGWAKHAWSCVFAPWNAGATVFVHAYSRFVAKTTLAALKDVDTLCAPPTVWRMFLLEDLAASKPARLREAVSAGEPLNPEVIERLRSAWGITVRDGYGQTETTALVGNTPGQEIVPGSMGRPLPGYELALLDAQGAERDEGEVAVKLSPRPLGLMTSYLDDPELTARCTAGGLYRTGDEATRDASGRFHFVGRGDDVFKSSDYRLSPFELESVLAEHPAIAESAVVPSPDPVRTSVPKAIVVLKPGQTPSEALAHEILEFVRSKVAPYKRIRRLEFAELPKTISGKIRRVELRKTEAARVASGVRPPLDFGPKSHD